MEINEKQALVILLMEDIRGNWGWENKSRTKKLRELAIDLDWQNILDSVDRYIDLCSEGENDGRYFRCCFKHGGYEDPPFEVSRDFDSYSDEFKKEALDYLTYPDHRFNNLKHVEIERVRSE